MVRAVAECRQSVLWFGTVGMTLVEHRPPEGLVVVPLVDMEPGRAVAAWDASDTNPLIRSFVRTAVAAYRD